MRAYKPALPKKRLDQSHSAKVLGCNMCSVATCPAKWQPGPDLIMGSQPALGRGIPNIREEPSTSGATRCCVLERRSGNAISILKEHETLRTNNDLGHLPLMRSAHKARATRRLRNSRSLAFVSSSSRADFEDNICLERNVRSIPSNA